MGSSSAQKGVWAIDSLRWCNALPAADWRTKGRIPDLPGTPSITG